MTIFAQCLRCDNFWGLTKCEAYEEKIPAEIATNEHDHRKPFKGDKGIRFKPIKE